MSQPESRQPESRQPESRQPESIRAACAVVAGLVAHGVTDVVACPGSRSAPLAYALAAAEAAGAIRVHMRIDERVAAFTALGLARFGPAAVVTTSGTAAANLHPALAEARHAGFALIAVTADRPHELRGVGANQATVQAGLYGPTVTHCLELPAAAPSRVTAGQLARLLSAATGVFGPPGPAHLNVAFRDPLTPAAPLDWQAWGTPVTAAAPELPQPPARGIAPYVVDAGGPTVVVAGDGAGAEAAEFAAAAGVPLFAEPSSGARGGPTAIGPYRELLAGAPGLVERIEQIVVFGRPTLSRPVTRLLAREVDITIVTATSEWVDVAGAATRVARAVAVGEAATPEWLQEWRDVAATWASSISCGSLTTQIMRTALAAGQPATYVGASMAIRHADLHAPVGTEFTTEPVLAGRGLAGIDGTIATATGIALGMGAPIRVILGDLSFAHDVGALALGPGEPEADVQIVVLNDNGGAIFATLEHGDHAETFDRLFATPVGMDLEALARGFGLSYRRVGTGMELKSALAEPVTGRSIIEVVLPRVSSRGGIAQ